MSKHQIVSAEQHGNTDQYTLSLKDLDITAASYKGREYNGTEAELREELKPYNFSENELDNQFRNARNTRRDEDAKTK
jgi:hypothetical protein